ncbi:MAG: hypothetical protein KBA26_09795 [Candidatus Delongbacteria bacterium]|nr:hypothetical protein [Candidatus Delongbacteria bacterium]
MQITLDKQQAENLIYSLFISTWISNEENSESKYGHEIENLEQAVLKQAYTEKWFDWIEYDKEMDLYFLNQKKEDELLENVIDVHDEESFWMELISGLAMRDMMDKFDDAELKTMSEDKKMTLRSEEENKYEEEFEKNGLARLRLVQ